MNLNTVSLVFLLCMVSSCSIPTMELKLQKGEETWKDRTPELSKDIYHSIYLIGDVGGSKEGKSTIPLIELKKQLSTDNRKDNATDVVFLGDNIYPVGMPPIGHEDRALAEHRLNMQLESVRKFDGNITFVPGNHDWYKFGREGLKRQEDYIESYLSQYNETFTDYFRPSNGCGEVAVMKIAKDIALISIDSHWFLSEKEKEYDYSDCDIQNRKQFLSAYRDTLENLLEYKVMLTMHHPFYTNGAHGGFYRKSSYLMPLKEYKNNLSIPMPLTGLIYSLIRPRISDQDTKSPSYSIFKEKLIPPIEKHGNTIVAAGHEHALQYHKVNDVDYIVSGSGSKKGPVTMQDHTKFAYGNYGYCLVDYHIDGSIWMSFYALEEDNKTFSEVYRSKLK